MAKTQYLQVPRAFPHRRARSRSRTRPREAVTEFMYTTKSMPGGTVTVSLSEFDEVKVPQTFAIGGEMWHNSPEHVIVKTKTCEEHKYAVHPITTKMTKTTAAFNDLPSPAYTSTAGYMTYGDARNESSALIQRKQSPSPISLRERLIGTWKLESYIAYPTPESRLQRPTQPMTRNVTGFILYTSDGYMAAQMLIPGQQSFKRGEGDEPQWAEASKRSFAYSGPFYISNEGPGREEVLRHTFQVCNLPGWFGDIQIRTHRFEEDGQVLVLGSEEPTDIKGEKRIPVLKWRRARNNFDGVPPPPTPQIKISGPGEP